MSGLAGYKGKVTIASDVTVADMATWSISGMENEMLESTVLTDTVKSYVPGRLDGGTATITGQYDPTDTNGQVALMANFTGKTAVTTPKLWYGEDALEYFEKSGGDVYVESITDFGVDQSGLGTIGFVLRISGGYWKKGA